jgi:hypothetical protein
MHSSRTVVASSVILLLMLSVSATSQSAGKSAADIQNVRRGDDVGEESAADI